jgi:hypothetical protein
MRRLAAALLMVLLGGARVSFAQAPTPEPDSPEVAAADDDPNSHDPISGGRRALAIGTSIMPGVLLHGSGQFTLGRRRTAYRLLAAEGTGLGMTLLGVGALAASGASRYLSAPAAVMTISGVGVFGTTLIADWLATAWPMEDRGSPLTTRPHAEIEIGYRAVHDPQFAYSHLMRQRLDLAWKGWRLSPEMWLALDDANARMRLEIAYRPFGPRSDRASSDGSYVDFRTALTHHRFTPEGFRTVTTELAARGRLDLVRFDSFLEGQFVELELGAAVQAYDYDAPGLGLGTDTETLLLTRFAHGVYIGRPPEPPYGEVLHFYDHRHDTYAGGLTGFAIGVPGFFGLDARLYPAESWGLQADVAVGSAVLGGLSLIARMPPPPAVEPRP